MALVLLRNKQTGKLIGVPPEKAKELLAQTMVQEVTGAIWGEIKPDDPDYAELCAQAEGRNRVSEDGKGARWAPVVIKSSRRED